MFQFDATLFLLPFNYDDSNDDSEVSTEEFKTIYNKHNDEFLAKYWHVFDTDNSGTLNFEEYMYVSAAVTGGVARFYIKVRNLIS